MSNQFRVTAVTLSILLDSRLLISRIIKVSASDQPQPLARLIILTSTLVMPDITKTSSLIIVYKKLL